MKILIIGFGYMGRLHFQKAKTIMPDGRFSVCDPNILPDLAPDGAAIIEEAEIPTKLIFDLAVIAVPSELHVKFLGKAVLCSARILVEKPLGYSSPERDFLLKSYKSKILVNSLERFGQLSFGLQFIVSNYADELNDINIVRTSLQRVFSPWYYDLAYHDLDLLCFLGLKPTFKVANQVNGVNSDTGTIELGIPRGEPNQESPIPAKLNYQCFHPDSGLLENQIRREYGFSFGELGDLFLNFETGQVLVSGSFKYSNQVREYLDKSGCGAPDKLNAVWIQIRALCVDVASSEVCFDANQLSVNLDTLDLLGKVEKYFVHGIKD